MCEAARLRSVAGRSTKASACQNKLRAEFARTNIMTTAASCRKRGTDNKGRRNNNGVRLCLLLSLAAIFMLLVSASGLLPLFGVYAPILYRRKTVPECNKCNKNNSTHITSNVLVGFLMMGKICRRGVSPFIDVTSVGRTLVWTCASAWRLLSMFASTNPPTSPRKTFETSLLE